MADGSNDDKNFSWLRRTSRGDSYVSYAAFSDFSACSFEFGHCGYAASCNYGGQLLQLSAPSGRGVGLVKGAFSKSLYASLARAQRDNGGYYTLGLEVATDLQANKLPTQDCCRTLSHFRLGNMLERGCFNYRWPLHEYSLIYNEKPEEDCNWPLENGKDIGNCVMLSFIESNVLYQVMRVDQSDGVENGQGQIRLTLGGLTQFNHYSSDCFTTRHEEEKRETGTHAPQSKEAGHVAPNPDHSDEKENPKTDERPFKCVQSLDEINHMVFQGRLYQYDEKKNGYVDVELHRSTQKDDTGASHYLESIEWTTCHALLPLFSEFDRGEPPGRHRSTVFVAAFRIFPGTELPNELWNPVVPDSSTIRDYIGANPNNASTATGFMWDTIYFKHRLLENPQAQVAEIRLIGRSLEKILHVDAMPARFSDSVMLVSNLFLEPDADYKSLFWKVRFLIKAYGFLRRYANDQTASSITRIEAIAGCQCRCIRKTLEEILRFLILQLSDSGSSLFKNNAEDGKGSSEKKDSETTDRSSIYYVMMTIWYVIKHQEPFAWVGSLLDKAATNIPDLCEMYPDNETFGFGNKDKILFLQWFHYGSIQKLYEATPLQPSIQHKVTRLEWAALNVSASKLSSKRPYSASDEIIDRLSFLAHELGLETIGDHKVSVASLAARRVSGRDHSRSLNPGPLEPNEEGFTDGFTDGPWEVHALCHHSRLVVVLLLENPDIEEANLYKERVCQFLNAEATIFACWERSHLKARKSFIHSEASSVFGSTLLDLYGKGEDMSQHGTRATDSTRAITSTREIVQELASIGSLMAKQLKALEIHRPEVDLALPIEWTETWRMPRHYHPDSFLESLDDTPDLYQQTHLKNVTIDPSLTEYVTSPGDRNFDVYSLLRLKELSWIRVADIVDATGAIKSDVQIAGFLDSNGPSRPAGWTKLQERDLLAGRLHDSLIDLDVRHRFVVVTKPTLRVRAALLGKMKTLLGNTNARVNPKRDPLGTDKALQAIRSKLLENENEELQNKKELLDALVYVICPYSASCLGSHLLKLSRFSFRNRNDWVARITLVTWEMAERYDVVYINKKTSSKAKNRNKVAPAALRVIRAPVRCLMALCCITESPSPTLPLVSSHMANGSALLSNAHAATPRNLSNPGDGDVEKAMGSSYPTSNESVSPPAPGQTPQNNVPSGRPGGDDQDIRNRMDLAPILVPDDLKPVIEKMQIIHKKLQSDNEKLKPDNKTPQCDDQKKRRQDELAKNIFKPQVSSFVLATNAFGDFSKCAIFSQLLADADLKVDIAKTAEKLWREFVHQPQTGRCLVFLQVLKVITGKMIGQYRKTLTIISSVLDLDDYLSQNLENWSDDSDAVRFFQLRLWSLEALYQLQRPLKRSIESVKEAKGQLCFQIKAGPGTRSEQLEKSCQRYLDSFESCFAELIAVAGDLERIIELNSRNKDAIEAILTLADSRASLAQNRTIERLTYLTIIYLPMGLMAAIFAIPETHNVVFQPMGRGWFIGSIFIMLIFTAALALCITNIFDLVKKAWRWLMERTWTRAKIRVRKFKNGLRAN